MFPYEYVAIPGQCSFSSAYAAALIEGQLAGIPAYHTCLCRSLAGRLAVLPA